MMKRYLLLIILIGNGCKATLLPCQVFEAGIQAGKIAIPAALGIGTIWAARNGLNWRQNPQPKPPSKAAQAKALVSKTETKLSDMFTSCKKTMLNLTQKHPIACALGGFAGGLAVGGAALAFFKRRNRLHQQFTEMLRPLRRQGELTERLQELRQRRWQGELTERLEALGQRAQQEADQLQQQIQHLEGENARLRHQLSQKNPFAELRLPSDQASRLPALRQREQVTQLQQQIQQLKRENAALAAAVQRDTKLLKDGV